MQISVNNNIRLTGLTSALTTCGHGIAVAGKAIWQAYCYVVSFKWLVDFVRYLVKTAGYASESAFVLATLYVTINMLAHTLLLQIVPESTLNNLDQLSVIAFGGLPELIVIAALTTCFNHWKFALRTRGDKKHFDAWAWAIGFSIPTVIFVIMTGVTLWQIKANGDWVPQTNDTMLRVRCFSGWFYAGLQMLFLAVGKPSYKEKFDTLQSDIDSKNATIKERDDSILKLQNDIATLQSDTEVLQQELMQARLQIAQRRVARVKEEVKEEVKGESESMTFEAEGVTMTATGNAAKMDRLKAAIQAAIARGGQFKMIDIAKEANVSYGMARQHVPVIIKELTQELPAISKIATATE